MNFLVKITNKNLGLSVISLEWYHTQCLLHLSNSIAYSEVNIRINTLYQNLAEIYNATHLPIQIKKYLQASTAILPQFYVIPKVHKTPWASRPIVPSHSWITSKVAEVVDYCLQPLLADFPTILSSSKEIIEKLHQVKSFADCYIITGDVIAMYTNINPFHAIEELRKLITRDLQKIKKSNLIQMIEFVLLNNFFKYQNKVYYQNSGLAIGVACAPVIANLFCGIYEKHAFKYRSKVQFYGRYIDDILCLFKGTEIEVKQWMLKWKLPGLDIKWEYSNTAAIFLDIELLIINNRLVTRVYKKILNKHMYIPFSSAHPLSVKKAFVKAERMRYSIICSQTEDIKSCEMNLYLNLLKRGYPQKILGEWFHETLAKVEKPIPKLILKSKYNPIWEYIRIGPIKNFLLESGENLDFETLVLSLKRGRSLYDIYNIYNLTLSTALELE